jgi:hypothetical protein
MNNITNTTNNSDIVTNTYIITISSIILFLFFFIYIYKIIFNKKNFSMV